MPTYKIGFVLDDSLDTPDGVQQYVLALGKWLSSEGHEVHYLVGQTHRSDMSNIHSLSRNVKVRFNQNRMSIPLPVSRRGMKAFLDAEQFDILHVQMPYSPMLAGRIILAAPRDTAILGTFHVAPYSSFVHMANSLLGTLLWRSRRRFDQVISVSSLAKEFALKTFHLDSIVIPNTRSLAEFFAAKPFPRYAHKRTIVFLGRLVKRKGCEHLLHAVASMHRNGLLSEETDTVIICGRGPLEGSLKQYAKLHHLEGLVEFAGFISEEDKPRFLASADIVAYPSTGGESFGIVLLEAMAASRGAVVGGNNPGYATVLSDHPEALFDPTDEQGFAQLLAHLLQDNAARAAAHTWQRREVKRYDVPNVGREIVEAYASALRKRKS